jgi:hypothetical protein
MNLKEKCEVLFKKWKEEIQTYETNYQFGRCGADDGTMDHGRYEQLTVCADYLEVVLKLEQKR